MKNLITSFFLLFSISVFAQLPTSKIKKSKVVLKANIGAMNVNEFADGVTLGVEVGYKFSKTYELSANMQISTNYERHIKTASSSVDPKTITLNKTYVYSDLQFISNFNLSYLFSEKTHRYDEKRKNDFVLGIGLGAFLASRLSVGKEDTTISSGSSYNTGQIYLFPSIAYRFSYIYNFENDYFLGGMLGQNILYEGGAFYCGFQIGKVL
ncbi:MAG: hypothetical protein ACPG6V_13855 [Flavobacteriales bacterium]